MSYTTPTTRNETRYHQVPRLHVKRKWMSPSATPTTQSTAAPQAINRAQAHLLPSTTPTPQNKCGCRHGPRLPRKMKVSTIKCSACHVCHTKYRGVTGTRLSREAKVHVTKYHTYHAKRRWVSPCATPATQSTAASPATSVTAPKRTTRGSPVPKVSRVPRKTKLHVTKRHPRLPRETQVDVTKCHACQVKRRCGCRQVPCLSRKVSRGQPRPSAKRMRSCRRLDCILRWPCQLLAGQQPWTVDFTDLPLNKITSRTVGKSGH